MKLSQQTKIILRKNPYNISAALRAEIRIREMKAKQLQEEEEYYFLRKMTDSAFRW